MLSRKEYQTEVNELAHDIWSEALEQSDNDKDDAQDLINETIHERVDGHHWVIYTRYHHAILAHSTNENAFQDVYCDHTAGEYLANNGIDAMITTMAFYAIEADVRDAIYEVLAA